MFEWLASHWEVMVAVASALLVGAIGTLKIVAPLTETPADDKVLSALEKVLLWFKPKA
jgi:hypothetical protein